MSLTMRWVGEADYDRVSVCRARCYAGSLGDFERYRSRLGDDTRGRPGDYLLAERDGEAIGTATSLSMTLWARGGSVSCQGVAFVGTIKTLRRTGGSERGRGIASQVMDEMLRKARERQQPVTALMPFRASFYEH